MEVQKIANTPWSLQSYIERLQKQVKGNTVVAVSPSRSGENELISKLSVLTGKVRATD